MTLVAKENTENKVVRVLEAHSRGSLCSENVYCSVIDILSCDTFLLASLYKKGCAATIVNATATVIKAS